MKKITLIIVIVFCSLVAMAQNGVIKGTLTDKNTGEPLVGATVVIKGGTTGTISNFDGEYILENIKPGTYVFVAGFIGYSSQEKEIIIDEEQTVTQNFQLYQDLIGLDEVMVTGVVNAKSAQESSVAMTTIKPKFMKDFGAVTTAEMFKAIPGIRSESSGGEGNANIAVRGVPVASGGSKFLLLQEDGMPVLQFGDIAFGNADIFMRADQTVGRVEALKGGSASTFASNSPAGIINFISKTGEVKGGSIGTTLGANYNSFRTDFEYGAPVNDNLTFHVGGFFRQGRGPRDPGFRANSGGQIKANITKKFEKGYARLYFKYLNDKAISYMPMPVMVSGSADNPSYESVPGFDLKTGALQSPEFRTVNSTDGYGNARTSKVSDGMHPVYKAVGGELSYNLGEQWQLKEKIRMAFVDGTFTSPFPAQLGAADDLATDIAGSGYSLSYANGTNAGNTLSASEVSNLNNNGLLMRTHLFDVNLDNLNNFTNDIFLTRRVDKMKATLGFYKAHQEIAMTWLFQTYLMDVSDAGPHLMNIANSSGTLLTENGLLSYGAPYWGTMTKEYDMSYNIDAPYFNMEYEVSDKINVDGSVRYDFGNASGYYLGAGTSAIDVNNDGSISAVEQEVPVLDSANPYNVDYNFGYLSYSFGANYKLDDNRAVYARYSEGGRANADRLLYTSFITDEGKTVEGLDADRIKQAELGYKYKSANLGVIATGFYTRINEQNLEFEKTINKEFETMGLELEVVAQFGKLNINSGATLTKAKILSSLTDSEVGNSPRRVPALLYNINPSYPFMNDKLVLGCSLVGTTKVYAQDDNEMVIPGYVYLNAFTTYKLIKGLTFRATVNNLTNTLGFTEMESDTFVSNSNNYFRARPITGIASNVSFTYKF